MTAPWETGLSAWVFDFAIMRSLHGIKSHSGTRWIKPAVNTDGFLYADIHQHLLDPLCWKINLLCLFSKLLSAVKVGLHTKKKPFKKANRTGREEAGDWTVTSDCFSVWILTLGWSRNWNHCLFLCSCPLWSNLKSFLPSSPLLSLPSALFLSLSSLLSSIHLSFSSLSLLFLSHFFSSHHLLSFLPFPHCSLSILLSPILPSIPPPLCRYKKTQETLSQAGQKTTAALSTMGTVISKRLVDMRYDAAEPKWPTLWLQEQMSRVDSVETERSQTNPEHHTTALYLFWVKQKELWTLNR